jgi:hypothetical protein
MDRKQAHVRCGNEGGVVRGTGSAVARLSMNPFFRPRGASNSVGIAVLIRCFEKALIFVHVIQTIRRDSGFALILGAHIWVSCI